MNYNNPQHLRTAQWIYFLVSILFCTFCFFFLWKVQGGMLGMAQHILSGGMTVYYPLVGALVLTFVLLLLQLILNKITRLHAEWYAVSFFPSFLLLTLLTSLDANLYTESGWGNWSWLGPLGLCIYVAFVFICKNFRLMSSHRGYGWELRLLIPNLVILLAGIFLTCLFSYTKKELHDQTEIEYAISNGDFKKALTVGKKNSTATRTTTALRAFALAREGELGEKMFNYPQYYGAEGLWLNRSDSVRMLYKPDSIYYYLGAYPSARTQTALMFLQYLDQSESQRKPMAKDYLLAALLLEKKLPEFVQELAKQHAITDSIKYPRYYQEALILYRHRFNPELPYENVVQETNYEDYQSIIRKGKTKKESQFRAGKDFGMTYWWYYDFATKKND